MTDNDTLGGNDRRIHVVVNEFPAVSETFVLDHITDLIDRGFDVRIFAARRSETACAHSAVESYGLLERTTFFARSRSLLGSLTRPCGALAALHLWRRLGRAEAEKFMALAQFHNELAACDLIHAHFGQNGAVVEAVRRCFGITTPLMTTFHGYDLSKLVQRRGPKLYDRLLASDAMALPISDRWRSRLIEMGARPENVRVLKMGVDVEQIDVRHRQRGVNDPLRVLSVGRLVEKKGLGDMIRAIPRVRQMAPDLDLSYQIVGDGPLRSQLMQLAEDLGVDDVVTFEGALSREDVEVKVAQADLFAAPSVTAACGDQEGIPVVLMEAMAVGLPVVSTWHSGIPELVQHGKTGLLADECRPEQLAEHIVAFARDPAMSGRMSSLGREVVESEHNRRTLADETAALYRSHC